MQRKCAFFFIFLIFGNLAASKAKQIKIMNQRKRYDRLSFQFLCRYGDVNINRERSWILHHPIFRVLQILLRTVDEMNRHALNQTSFVTDGRRYLILSLLGRRHRNVKSFGLIEFFFFFVHGARCIRCILMPRPPFPHRSINNWSKTDLGF